jgi:hypothetical protein
VKVGQLAIRILSFEEAAGIAVLLQSSISIYVLLLALRRLLYKENGS